MASMELQGADVENVASIAQPVHGTREEWLNAFVKGAAQAFEAVGSPIPRNTRVGVGFTSKGARGKAIGQCWSNVCSDDDTFEIIIHVGLDDPHYVCGVLTHELIHAAVGLEAKHGPLFKSCAVALGLGGKMTATVTTEHWNAWADRIIAELGPYPHAALRGQHDGRKKQKTALLKLVCDECGWLARVTAKHIEPHDHLSCPVPSCDGILQVAE